MTGQRQAERITWLDWAMVGLAVASLLLLVLESAFATRLTPGDRVWIVRVDLAIVLVFALEFGWRLSRVQDRWGYIKSHWYDLLGMVPVSHPFFRGFRLLRILRIVVITSRFVRATNRTFGEMAFEATVRKFRVILVENIVDAVLVAGIKTVQPWLTRAQFAARVGDSMEGRRTEIRKLVRLNVSKAPGGRQILKLPYAETALAAVEEAALDAVIETLQSEELNLIIQDTVRNVLEELSTEIARKEYATPDAAYEANSESSSPRRPMEVGIG